MQYPLIAREGCPIYLYCLRNCARMHDRRLAEPGNPWRCAFLCWRSWASFLFLLFCLYFFRDPERVPTRDDHALISPADGTVIDVKNVTENCYLQAPAQRISIFMSVFNVHVNRTPLSGTIDYVQYNPGKFINSIDVLMKHTHKKKKTRRRNQLLGVEFIVWYVRSSIACVLPDCLEAKRTGLAGSPFNNGACDIWRLLSPNR